MILKMVRFRSLKFRPRIATTLRPHGKWGDLIVCIIPVSWCANIITNSNFILRMIEWQSESGLLTVRIRGKQWYWVYKFELKTFTDVFTVPKNVGHNKWQISTPNDLQVADDYLHILQLRSQNRWVKSYWEELSKEMSKSKNFHMISPKDFVANELIGSYEDMLYRGRYASYSPYNELDHEGVTYVYDRNLICYSLQNFLKIIGLFDNEDNSKPLDSELVESIVEILKENPISKKDFIFLIKNRLLPDTNYPSIDYHLDYFDLPNKYNNKVNSEGEFMDIDFTDSKKLVEYLKVATEFNDNKDFGNFNLLVKLMDRFNTYFVENEAKYFDEEDSFVQNNFVMTKTDFIELQERLENIKSSEEAESIFDFPVSEITSDFDSLVGDKIWLDSSNYSDLLIRLSNKKSNWDESTLLDSLDESFKFFLTNDEIFESRSDEVNHSSNSFMDKKYFFPKRWDGDSEENYVYSDFNEFDRNSRKSQGTVSPVRLIKYPISNKTNFDLSSDVVELFRFRFNENESSTEHRITPNSAFLIIRQKRYKRRKVILPRTIFYKDEDGNPIKRVKSSNYTFLSQNSIILENDFNATKRYKFFRKNKMRDELTNLVLSKRILRTRRTLVLPAHLNITAITNSFDVIHSWFIPGLGLKLDAIPGRATHHTFYIDNVGFYYGQCAEICGRYHHHMPIRICALPFEHFLLWWQSFGLPKLLFTKNFRRYSYSYGSRKYAW